MVIAGLSQKEKQNIFNEFGIKEGSLPFKYLGCPISASRLTVADCDVLIEKITARISSWKTKHLSYVGRARLIQSVLFGMVNFWARIFVIPGRVMKKVEGLARNYLWGSSEIYKRVPLVNWEDTCKPKVNGGLGLPNIRLWNKAMIMALNWDIARKKDCLWVKWVHSRYLKKVDDFWGYKPRTEACSYWKKMIKIRRDFEGMPSTESYTNEKGYKWLLGQSPKTGWAGMVWNRLTIPKHQFLVWLIMKNRLQTKARLTKFMSISTDCGLCDKGIEDNKHLFGDCAFYIDICRKLKEEGGCNLTGTKLEGIYTYFMNQGPRKERARMIANWAAVCYMVWRARNTKIHTNRSLGMREIVDYILFVTKCYSNSKGKQV
ncbi:unnamed protein product [Cuscuta campestris]|uniref:Reverse transcriptase zinc-binding domain-containing protein n=1 Tax=Cuscuta campestris TaxID=132261 RepID=A0A484NEB9_9ASTE|nr:unnamed protein product [Cuscuta campestris]